MISSMSYAAQAHALIHTAPELGLALDILCAQHALLGVHVDGYCDVPAPETERLEDMLFGLCLDLLNAVHEDLRVARTPEHATWLQQVRVLSWRLGYALAQDDADAALIHSSAG